MVDLPAPDRPVNHSTRRLLALAARRAPPCRRRRACQWMLCARRSAKCSMPGADRVVGQPVDEDEAAGVAVVGVGIERRSAGRGEVADADLVELERLGREVLEGVDVDLVLGLGDRGADACARRSSSGRGGPAASAPRPSRRACASNWSATSAGASAAADHVAARDVDLVGERQGDRLAGDGLVEVAVER